MTISEHSNSESRNNNQLNTAKKDSSMSDLADVQMPASHLARRKSASFLTKTMASLAMLPPVAGLAGLFSKSADAQEAQRPVPRTQEYERTIRESAQATWREISTALAAGEEVHYSEWNDLIAALLVTDSTGITGLDDVRAQVIERGLRKPDVPGRVVDAAVYSLTEYVDSLDRGITAHRTQIAQLERVLNQQNQHQEEAQQLQNELSQDLRDELGDRNHANDRVLRGRITALQTELGEMSRKRTGIAQRFSRILVPLVGNVIVDVEHADDRTERHLLSPAAAAISPGTKYSPEGFENLGGYALGKLADPTIHEHLLEELDRSRGDWKRMNEIMDVFVFADKEDVPQALIERLGSFIKYRSQGVIADTTEKTRRSKLYSVIYQLNEGLTTNEILDPQRASAGERMLMAKSIYLLAQAESDLTLPAVAQWMALRPYATDALASEADSHVMNALLMACQHSNEDKAKEALVVLEHALPSHPKMFFMALNRGASTSETTMETRAGRSLMNLLNQEQERFRGLLQKMIDREAPILWNAEVNDARRDLFRNRLQEGREWAIDTAAYFDTTDHFNEELKEVLRNPFLLERNALEVNMAMSGLSLSRDTSAIPLLLEKVVDPHVPEGVRANAIAAIRHIDSASQIPDEIRQRLSTEGPFSPVIMRTYFSMRNPNNGEVLDAAEFEKQLELFKSSSPFAVREFERFHDWLDRQNNVVANARRQGQAVDNIGIQQQLDALRVIRAQETGRASAALRELAKSPENRERFFMPMVRYLEDAAHEDNSVDLNYALNVCDVLGRAGIPEARTVLHDMMRNPEKYISEADVTTSMFEAMFMGSTAQRLKSAATQAMGGLVDLSDSDDVIAKDLHRILRKESATAYRDDAKIAFEVIADRYNEALADGSLADDAREALWAAQAGHAEQMVGHFSFHRQGLENQSRRKVQSEEFYLGRLAIRFGGAEELLDMVDAEVRDNMGVFDTTTADETSKNLRPDIAMAVMQALKSNGHDAEYIAGLGLDDAVKARMQTVYNFVAEEKYWRGPSDLRLTGEGVEVALLDAGYTYALTNPGLDSYGKIKYPETMPGWDNSQLGAFESSHSTAVGMNMLRNRPDMIGHTYSAWAELLEVPFRPAVMQEPVNRAVEDIIEKVLRGEANIVVINYSFGWSNIAVADEQMREEFFDLISAYMELSAKIGIQHTVSAGNSHGDDPGVARALGLGEVNNLGLRQDEEGNWYQPEGVSHVAALDAFAGSRLASFTSKGDTLRPQKGITQIAVDGRRVLLPWFEGTWRSVPLDGTSFAAPNLAQLKADAEEVFLRAGIDVSNAELTDLLVKSTVAIPDREAYEGGLRLHEPTFWRNVSSFIDERREVAE